MQFEKDKNKKLMNELETKKDEEIKHMKDEKDAMGKELEDFKKDMNLKMMEINIMKNEL